MKLTRKYAVGVDMGATTIKAGMVTPKGAILDQISIPTRADKGPRVVMTQLIYAIREILAKQKTAECFGIGIGAPGIVVIEDGSVHNPPNFADWDEVQVAKHIRKAFPLPVFIENDANCAAIAEARYGVGLEHKDFLFVIWGTGVGGGIIMDREIYRGPHGGAGEIGHVSIDYNGRPCNCGGRGCIEAYIGQRYLSTRTREILESSPQEEARSKIISLVNGNLQKIEPAIISQAAEMGDPKAFEILREAGELLGYALASAVNILDLRIAVIGGGISAAPDFVFETIESSLRSRVLAPHKKGVHVLRARLGNPAGIIGAASLVF
ncbi:MAG TPA: ROK family protein [Bacteroidota bacterium]|nr:ROK family protein [Bacteroidota bacterium]